MTRGWLAAAAVAGLLGCSADAPTARPSPGRPTSPSVEPSAAPTPSVRPSQRTTPSATPRRTPSRRPSPSVVVTSPARPVAPTRSTAVFRGLGTWVDGFDFSRELGGRLQPDAVDAMAAAGVRTLYLQAAREHERAPGLLLSPDLLGEWLRRAHGRGIRVVAWYLPTFTDPERDWAHLRAMLDFRSEGHRFDAIGVDIESRELADVDLRNERLVALSRRLRAAAPAVSLQAIVLPPVVTDVIAPDYWPRFPWRRLVDLYDAWSPMGYWTNRTPESGWRDAYRYTVENVRLTRRNLGRPGAVVHIVGGIGDRVTDADLEQFARAAHAERAVGGSLYDYATTPADAWPRLRGVPR